MSALVVTCFGCWLLLSLGVLFELYCALLFACFLFAFAHVCAFTTSHSLPPSIRTQSAETGKKSTERGKRKGKPHARIRNATQRIFSVYIFVFSDKSYTLTPIQLIIDTSERNLVHFFPTHGGEKTIKFRLF